MNNATSEMVAKYKQNMLNVINTLEQGDTEEPMVAEAIENTKEVVDFLDAFQVLLHSIETQDNSLSKHPVLLSAFSLITKQVGQVLKATQLPTAPVAPVAPAGGNLLSSAPAPQGVVTPMPAPTTKSQEEIQRELDEKLQETQRQSSLTNSLQQQLIQNAAATVQPPVAVPGQAVPVQGAQPLPINPVAPVAPAPVPTAGETATAQEKLNALLGQAQAQKAQTEHQAPTDLTEQMRQQLAGNNPGVVIPAPAEGNSALTEQLRQQMQNNQQ